MHLCLITCDKGSVCRVNRSSAGMTKCHKTCEHIIGLACFQSSVGL